MVEGVAAQGGKAAYLARIIGEVLDHGFHVGLRPHNVAGIVQRLVHAHAGYTLADHFSELSVNIG